MSILNAVSILFITVLFPVLPPSYHIYHVLSQAKLFTKVTGSEICCIPILVLVTNGFGLVLVTQRSRQIFNIFHTNIMGDRNNYIILPQLSLETCNKVKYTLLLHTEWRNVRSNFPFLRNFEEYEKRKFRIPATQSSRYNKISNQLG